MSPEVGEIGSADFGASFLRNPVAAPLVQLEIDGELLSDLTLILDQPNRNCCPIHYRVSVPTFFSSLAFSLDQTLNDSVTSKRYKDVSIIDGACFFLVPSRDGPDRPPEMRFPDSEFSLAQLSDTYGVDVRSITIWLTNEMAKLLPASLERESWKTAESGGGEITDSLHFMSLAHKILWEGSFCFPRGEENGFESHFVRAKVGWCMKENNDDISLLEKVFDCWDSTATCYRSGLVKDKSLFDDSVKVCFLWEWEEPSNVPEALEHFRSGLVLIPFWSKGVKTVCMIVEAADGQFKVAVPRNLEASRRAFEEMQDKASGDGLAKRDCRSYTRLYGPRCVRNVFRQTVGCWRLSVELWSDADCFGVWTPHHPEPGESLILVVDRKTFKEEVFDRVGRLTHGYSASVTVAMQGKAPSVYDGDWHLVIVRGPREKVRLMIEEGNRGYFESKMIAVGSPNYLASKICYDFVPEVRASLARALCQKRSWSVNLQLGLEGCPTRPPWDPGDVCKMIRPDMEAFAKHLSRENVSNIDNGKILSLLCTSLDDMAVSGGPHIPSVSFDQCSFCSKVAFDLPMCSLCKVTRYCNERCQRRDINNHQRECRTERFAEANEILKKLSFQSFGPL